MEGELFKYTGGSGSWQCRHFTLSNGLLFYRKFHVGSSPAGGSGSAHVQDDYRGCLLCTACEFVRSEENECRFDLKTSQVRLARLTRLTRLALSPRPHEQ